MIEENAVVVGLEKEMALLEVVRRKPCGLCGQTRGCGMSLWGRLLGHRKNIFKAVNEINAKLGDSVIVGVEEQALLFSSLSFYGIPLLTMFAGTLVASSLFTGDGYAVAGAILGLFIGLLWLKGNATGRNMYASLRPVILRTDNGVDDLKM